MRGKAAALIMAAVLVLYLVLTIQQAIAFLASGEAIGVVMGVALLTVPLVGAWALYREVLFGVRTERLVRILAARGQLPVEDMPTRPSGRPYRDAADAEFDVYRAEVEQRPKAWESWFRLGLAYDASGDRRRARRAIRRSFALYRTDVAEH